MAVLAATADGRSIKETAAAMVRIGAEIGPDANRHLLLTDIYLRFVEHLHDRGRLPQPLTTHAYRRAEH